jgi:hypothetical protein
MKDPKTNWYQANMQPRDMDAILPDPVIELVIRNQLQHCEYKTVLHTVEMDQVCFARRDDHVLAE